jgi:asparagine synthase (glutamine-hydrolysing)
MQINMIINSGYHWYSQDNIYVKGYIIDDKNNLLEKDDLIVYFKDINNIEDIKKKISKLFGIFSIVLKIDKKFFLISDNIRTFPLFYIISNEKVYISDSAHFLQKQLDLHFDSTSEEQMLCTGYVLEDRTLLKGLKQVESSEIVAINKHVITKEEYFNYTTDKVFNYDLKKFQDELYTIFEKVIKRLITSAKGKTLCIPLSGGYDSRIILVLLKKHNYKNIICFTYGHKTSYEVTTSKRIAKKLGYRWYFIEYTDNFMQEHFDDTFIDYVKYASNYASIAHIQDYFAVKALMQIEGIPKDMIFVPGHSGDIFAGTHIGRGTTLESNISDVLSHIKNKHFNLCKTPKFDSNLIKEKLSNGFSYSQMEAWSAKERQSKFIVNANRVYEFFGCEHRVPLWDQELTNFFKFVPLKYKNRNDQNNYTISSNLFDSVLFIYFREFNISKKKNSFFMFPYRVLTRLNLYQINNFIKLKQLLRGTNKKILPGHINHFVAEFTLQKIKNNMDKK